MLTFLVNRRALEWRPSEGVGSAYLLLQQAAIWGTTGGDTLADTPIGVHQAWFMVKPTKTVALQLGRMELLYGDQRVLGAANWNQVGRAWDGGRVMLKPAKGLKLDLFAAQYNEGSSNPTTANGGTYSGGLFDDDSWLGGVYFTVGKTHLKPVLAV